MLALAQQNLFSRFFSTSFSAMKKEIMDGNTAASSVSYAFSDVAFIYPITPSSTMGEMADYWAAHGKKNLFGDVLTIVEMQSEAGAAGALHGALSAGALGTTYTASQGLLLMIPNLYKLAGERLPAVLHVSARAVAGEALSIFGDHSDVMACRQTGVCLLAAATVQEAHDMAVVAHLSAIEASLPFIHFFDGFRTSAEVNTIETIPEEILKELMDLKAIRQFRNRSLNPEHPMLKGTNQGPEVFMQQVERLNPYYLEVPAIVEKAMSKLAEKTSRKYELFEYFGHPEAENVIVIMGSGVSTTKQCVSFLEQKGEKVGVLSVKLYRPWSAKHFLEKLPKTVKKIAVMDRTKEPGSNGEPLKLDVISALQTYANEPKKFNTQLKVEGVIGGRYGLGSKEFAPEMVMSIYNHMKKPVAELTDSFTVGIVDDTTFLSLPEVSAEEKKELLGYISDKAFQVTKDAPKTNMTQCVFWGLGSDGTVGANKDAVKLLVKETKDKDFYGQAYFAYSAHKSGGLTQSYLRFSEGVPFEAPYLIRDSQADYVACHSANYILKYDLLRDLKENGMFVLNHHAITLEKLEKVLPNSMKRSLAEKNAQFYVIDANTLAEKCGLGQRINTIMQTVFFKLMDKKDDSIIKAFKNSIVKQYTRKGEHIVKKNIAAVDMACDTQSHLHKIEIPAAWKELPFEPLQPYFFDSQKTYDRKNIPEFIEKVQFPMNQMKGDDLPTSVFPPGGILPVGTTKFEKRLASDFVPVWDVKTCIQCNICAAMCPHAAIRPILFSEKLYGKLPKEFTAKSKTAMGLKNLPKDVKADDVKFKIQVSPSDCTGCKLCVQICPAKSLKFENGEKVRKEEGANWSIAESDKMKIQSSDIWKLYAEKPEATKKVKKQKPLKSVAFETPLLEFSGSCQGCSETSVAKTLTQLFGQQMIISNATGCSSIWGGSYPTIPYTKDPKTGYGPAWANSLFEDNAEHGLGIAMSTRHRRESLLKDVQPIFKGLKQSKSEVAKKLVAVLSEWMIPANFDDRETSFALSEQLKPLFENALKAKDLSEELKKGVQFMKENSDMFAKKSVWIVGGDGWAYDIGYGGLDHVFASGEDIKILIFDTEVYSNTGGQMSKATPRAAVAKFSESGRPSGKKDMITMALSYENVYIGTCNSFADPNHLVKTLQEAEAHKGVSVVVCYSNCINHGITYTDKLDRVKEMKLSVESGYFPLMRYTPSTHKFVIDAPKKYDEKKLDQFVNAQARFQSLNKAFPEDFAKKQKLLRDDVQKRLKKYQLYEREYHKIFEEQKQAQKK